MLTMRRQIKEVKGMRSSLRAVMRWTMLVLVVLPLGSACSQETTPPPPTKSDTKAQPIPDGVMPKLSFDPESELAVVFAVTRKGEIKAWYNPKARLTPKGQLKFPKAEIDIDSSESVSIFQTKNPTTCWINSRGTQECVTWPAP